MLNKGFCECGGHLALKNTDGRVQEWKCEECPQKYYRILGGKEIFKNLNEILDYPLYKRFLILK